MPGYNSFSPIARGFYLAPPHTVAPALLGKILVRKLDGATLAGRIVEVEAYLGVEDPAAHTFHGKTARNEVLFGPPGHAYVYFIYGMHSCLNLSCEPEGYPGCVLIRALQPLAGLDRMEQLRGATKPELLASGPGRLCQALGITRASLNGVDVTSRSSPLRVVDDGFTPNEICAGPRIGIRKATELPLRFFVEGHKHLSRP